METNKSSNSRSNTVSVEKNRAHHAKRERRKKILYASGGIMLVILLIGAALFYQDQRIDTESDMALLEKKNEVLEVQLQERDSLLNEWVSTFNKIERDMAELKEREQILTNKTADPELSDDRREQILSDLQYVNSLLQKNKEQLQQLNKKLRSSGVKIKSLEEKIAMLDRSITERDSSINELKMALIDKDFHIADLNSEMEELEKTLNLKESVIKAQESELNKAYLAYGTYKELKEKGVLTKEGGFLWVGKNTTLKEDFNEHQFTEINLKETKKIPVNSKEMKIVTEHPAESYEVVRDEEMIAYIEITDPAEFWKVSKYAVVETKD